MMNKLKPPYYAVIFTSKRANVDQSLYIKTSDRMVELASKQPGFLGITSTRGTDGVGITVSYWETKENILNWKKNSEHFEAQKSGRNTWYEWYDVKICLVEREYGARNS
jgi:heme-degrading monooxygenase HmoA